MMRLLVAVIVFALARADAPALEPPAAKAPATRDSLSALAPNADAPPTKLPTPATAPTSGTPTASTPTGGTPTGGTPSTDTPAGSPADTPADSPSATPDGSSPYTLGELPISSVNDQIFWPLDDQVIQEDSVNICVFDKDPPAGKAVEPGTCKTNIGYFLTATGITYAQIKDPSFNYLLRFRIPRICDSATTGTSRGQGCAEWVEDQSRKPLAALHKVFVDDICYTLRDESADAWKRDQGCGYKYPWGDESQAEFDANKKCEAAGSEGAKAGCFNAVFAGYLGWNITVLNTMLDLVRQNGHDCENLFLDNADRFTGDAKEICVAGGSPHPKTHPVLVNLAQKKGFYATPIYPLIPQVNAPPAPPPKGPSMPPPAPLSPPPTTGNDVNPYDENSAERCGIAPWVWALVALGAVMFTALPHA